MMETKKIIENANIARSAELTL